MQSHVVRLPENFYVSNISETGNFDNGEADDGKF